MRNDVPNKTETPEELVERYYPDIFRYIYWRVRDRQIAEDITQETFLKAIRYYGSMGKQLKYRALLYKIAANLCVDLSRRKSTEPLREDIPGEDAGFGQVEATDSFAKLVEQLPEGQKEIVTLRFGHDLKMREIAGIVKLPLRTVQSRLRAALKSLKTSITKGGRHE